MAFIRNQTKSRRKARTKKYGFQNKSLFKPNLENKMKFLLFVLQRVRKGVFQREKQFWWFPPTY